MSKISSILKEIADWAPHAFRLAFSLRRGDKGYREELRQIELSHRARIKEHIERRRRAQERIKK